MWPEHSEPRAGVRNKEVSRGQITKGWEVMGFLSIAVGRKPSDGFTRRVIPTDSYF